MSDETATVDVEQGAEAGRAPAAGRRERPGRKHEGVQYLNFFKRVAEISQPTTYLEIGTRDGSSLAAFTGCDAICVDPIMRPKPVALDRRSTFCFQMSSDRFFHETDVFAFFPRGIDIAFLDGMHRFEYLLRDFINTEPYCHPRSLIMVHDCFPARADLAGRVSKGGAWAGDVWKLVPILAELRPDLTMRRIDCPPTGLLAVQSAAPESTALRENYQEIVREYGEMSLDDYGIDRLWDEIDVIESRALVEDESLWSLHLPTF
jgi:hypothetical protein